MLTMNEILSVSESFIHLEEFVDRTVETNQFQMLVDKRYEDRDAHKRIIAFYGQTGIGKTMLLDRIEFECVRMEVPYSRINFEVGTYNNAIEILRELVRELGPTAFKSWTQLEQYWFSSELNTAELNMNIKVDGGGGGYNFQGANLNVDGSMVSGDMVAGSKVEIRNNTINVSTRAALDPLGAQTALTESFVKALGEFVQERPAVILFEGLDHEYCSPKTRVWVDGLLDRIRVLKGFGVLPVATYFNAPNFEARLRSVTFRAELKPLEQEHIVEYFRTRRIPENIILEAARICFEETQGIPARVYEYTENLVSELGELIAQTLVQNVVEQVQETLEQPQEVQEAALHEPTQPTENAILVEVPAEVIESVVIVHESAIGESIEDTDTMEEESAQISEPLVETPSVAAEVLVSDSPQQAEETLEAVVPEDEISEDVAGSIESDQPVKEETKTDSEVNALDQESPVIEMEFKPEEQAQAESAEEPEIIESIPQANEELKVVPPPAEIESKPIESDQPEIVANQEMPEPVPQSAEEPTVESNIEVTSQDVPPVATPVAQVETPAAPHPVQPTADEVKLSEEALQRSQERLKQLKSEGKSSTANMVETVLGRQSADVADIARRCAVLRWFTADLIEVVANQDLMPEQAMEILHSISSWAFVQNFGYGTYAFRREVQHYLRAQMQNESPELYVEIHRKAYAYFDKKLGLKDSVDEMIWVNLQPDQINALREYLYYLLHVDVARGFNLLGQLFQSAQRLYMHGEAAILLKFADEVDKSALGENFKNQLAYYQTALEFAEGDAASAEGKLRELMTHSLEDELKAQVFGQLGVILAGGGKYDEAIKAFEQAQKIWQSLKRERERAKLSNNLGNVYMRKNDTSRAERSFTDALSGLTKAGTPSERALTLNNLGNVYMQRENLSKALEHYQKSLEIKNSIGDQFGAANTYSNLGTVYQRMAQEASGKKQAEYRQQATGYYTRSLETYRIFGARSNQGRLLFKLAYFYFQTGDKVKAREYLPDALEIFQDLEMPELENASKLEKQLG